MECVLLITWPNYFSALALARYSFVGDKITLGNGAGDAVGALAGVHNTIALGDGHGDTVNISDDPLLGTSNGNTVSLGNAPATL
jgi:hypothetical protein